jgi:hypothetical protein
MSRLLANGRAWVVFDPANAQHRRWYSDFVKLNSWAQCPVRFCTEQGHSNLLAVIQRQLADYYAQREFGKKST